MSKVNKKKMYNTIYDKMIAITSSLKKLLYHSCISALEGYGPLQMPIVAPGVALFLSKR